MRAELSLFRPCSLSPSEPTPYLAVSSGLSRSLGVIARDIWAHLCSPSELPEPFIKHCQSDKTAAPGYQATDAPRPEAIPQYPALILLATDNIWVLGQEQLDRHHKHSRTSSL